MLYNRPVKSKDNQSWVFFSPSRRIAAKFTWKPLPNCTRSALKLLCNQAAERKQNPKLNWFPIDFRIVSRKRGGIHTHPSSTHPHSCLRKFFRLVLPSPLSGSSFSFRPLCGLTLWHLLHQPIIIAMASMHSPIDLINLREKRMFVPHFSADHPRNLLFPNSDD